MSEDDKHYITLLFLQEWKNFLQSYERPLKIEIRYVNIYKKENNGNFLDRRKDVNLVPYENNKSLIDDYYIDLAMLKNMNMYI